MLKFNRNLGLNPRLVGQVFRPKVETKSEEYDSLNPRLVGQVFRLDEVFNNGWEFQS